MKIEMLKDCIVSGEPHFRGQKLDVDPDTFKILEQNRQAKALNAEPTPLPETLTKGKR